MKYSFKHKTSPVKNSRDIIISPLCGRIMDDNWGYYENAIQKLNISG